MNSLMIRELKNLVGKVNEIRKTESSHGGYFCCIAKGKIELVARIGDTGSRSDEYFHSAVRLARAQDGNPKLEVRESMGASYYNPSNDHTLSFAGYPTYWSEALLYALIVVLGWMKKDEALEAAPLTVKLNLAALLKA